MSQIIDKIMEDAARRAEHEQRVRDALRSNLKANTPNVSKPAPGAGRWRPVERS